jgi:elongation factor Ts
MIECKKALEASDNDLETALDWLRRQGASKAASKLMGRETLQGLVGLSVSNNGREAALVQVAAETDFAGRSKTFVDLVVGVSKATLESSASGSLSQDDVLKARTDNKSVQALLNEAIVAIRENLSVSQAIKLTTATDQNVLVGYVHNKIDASNAGTSAALVELQPIQNSSVSLEDLQAIGKKLAMHVVAARPQYLTPSDVPLELVNKEKELLASQIEDTGKPQEVLDRIIEGRLRKFYESICLTEQGHMIEEKNPKVSEVLKRQGVAVNRFESLFIS